MVQSGRQAKSRTQFGPDATHVNEARSHLTRGGPLAWITIAHGIPAERDQNPPERRQRAVMRQEQVKKILKIVSLWHDGSVFLQQSLEILLGRLLAVEAHEIA